MRPPGRVGGVRILTRVRCRQDRSIRAILVETADECHWRPATAQIIMASAAVAWRPRGRSRRWRTGARSQRRVRHPSLRTRRWSRCMASTASGQRQRRRDGVQYAWQLLTRHEQSTLRAARSSGKSQPVTWSPRLPWPAHTTRAAPPPGGLRSCPPPGRPARRRPQPGPGSAAQRRARRFPGRP